MDSKRGETAVLPDAVDSSAGVPNAISLASNSAERPVTPCGH